MANILGKLKAAFNPSETVSAARRKKVFGTESKTVAGAAIVGTALTAGFAPAALAARGGIATVGRAAASKIGSFAVQNPVKAVVLGTAGTAIAGRVASDPLVVSRTVGGFANFQGNVYEFGKEPTAQNFASIVKENPVISGLVAAGTGVLVGGGVAAATNLLNTQATSRNTEAIRDLASSGVVALPANNIQAPAFSMGTPMTAQTQALSASGPRSISRYRKPKAPQQIRQSVRVNIINASRLGNKTYIRKYA